MMMLLMAIVFQLVGTVINLTEPCNLAKVTLYRTQWACGMKTNKKRKADRLWRLWRDVNTIREDEAEIDLQRQV